MKKPRKPKMLKYPKKPKQSASFATWERYWDKVKEIDKENQKRMNEYHKLIKQLDAEKRKKEELIRKAQNHRPPVIK